jgi:hypothetical protein
MQRDCPECQRLWREYAAATTSHVGMENRMRGLKQGTPESEVFTREVTAAASVREGARQAIHDHETAAHGTAAGAAEANG